MMIALFGMPRERLVAVWEARPRDRVPNWPYRMERAVRNVASLQDPLPPSWRPSPTNWRSTNEQIEVITMSDRLCSVVNQFLATGDIQQRHGGGGAGPGQAGHPHPDEVSVKVSLIFCFFDTC